MKSLLIFAIAVLLGNIVPANGQVPAFTEDFEGGLSTWTGKAGGAHFGAIVPDPVNPANSVLVFTAVRNTGDIFSPEIPVEPVVTYVLSFDYLGVPLTGSPDGNYGGTIGFSDAVPGDLRFLASTIWDNFVVVELVDDGTWHSYSITFHPYDLISVSNGTIRVMIEDWDGAGCASCPEGVPGDSFFDNIKLERLGPVPVELSTWGHVKSLFR